MYLFWHVVYWPCQASPTSSRIYLSPPWVVGDNTSCSTSFSCGLLALPSLTYTLKDLPLPPYPPMAAGNDMSHSTPFACGLLALWVVASPTHSRIYPCHVKWEPQLGLSSWRRGNHMSQRRGNHTSQRRCHKDGVITNIIAQGQIRIKSTQVKCIQIHSLLPSSFIRYFNNQIFTIFSNSSKPFLVKNILHQFPK